ncbi:MarR family winged helix-turn-helix transcriptional regulator [Brevibacterium aurantiacum]|uniref:MarR family winged helix-turn-helix transcriptional regulator n=1 Tax=Brevibacterium aurantiacum TaxID=273384 RepID=UPI0000510455|nr:MarR family transcriptional regulator [Brevibacterium aurantiacum]
MDESQPLETDSGSAETLQITELLSFRVRRLANLLSASAGPRFRREFEVSLPEWRTLALLGQTQPMTVNKLARLAALDKAQMSRVLSGLVERDLVAKSLGPRRSSQLTLTDTGQALFERIIAAANERDRTVLAALDDEEKEVLDRALNKLADVAILLEHHEHEAP